MKLGELIEECYVYDLFQPDEVMRCIENGWMDKEIKSIEATYMGIYINERIIIKTPLFDEYKGLALILNKMDELESLRVSGDFIFPFENVKCKIHNIFIHTMVMGDYDLNNFLGIGQHTKKFTNEYRDRWINRRHSSDPDEQVDHHLEEMESQEFEEWRKENPEEYFLGFKKVFPNLEQYTEIRYLEEQYNHQKIMDEQTFSKIKFAGKIF